MKKLLFVISLFVCSIATAQEKVDFFKFIDQIDWNSTRDEFIEKHRDMIIPDSLAVEKVCMKSIDIDNIAADEVNVTFDSVTMHLEGVMITYRNSFDMESVENKQWHETILQNLNVNIGSPFETSFVNNYYFHKNALVRKIMGYPFTLTFVDLFPPAPQYEKDFRVANWGDSKEKVRANEQKPNKAVGADHLYGFEDYLGNLKCTIGYIFTNNKLTRGKYIFQEISDDMAIYEYERLQKMLDKKYGIRAAWDTSRWVDEKWEEKYKDNEIEAIKKGYRRRSKFWCNGSTEVFLNLLQPDTENQGWQLGIEYEGREMKKLREQAMLDAL